MKGLTLVKNAIVSLGFFSLVFGFLVISVSIVVGPLGSLMAIADGASYPQYPANIISKSIFVIPNIIMFMLLKQRIKFFPGYDVPLALASIYCAVGSLFFTDWPNLVTRFPSPWPPLLQLVFSLILFLMLAMLQRYCCRQWRGTSHGS